MGQKPVVAAYMGCIPTQADMGHFGLQIAAAAGGRTEPRCGQSKWKRRGDGGGRSNRNEAKAAILLQASPISAEHANRIA